MNIRVEYMSQLRSRIGCSDETFDLPSGTKIEGLLLAIAECHGEDVRALLFDESGAVAATMLYFVAEEQADKGQILNDGDVVIFLTPMSGG